MLLGIIVGLIILVLLVAVHEFGHGVAARRNGVVVEEFGIGFPPKAWGKKIKKSILGKNVLYSLNWLPLGGFVKLQGEYDSASKKGDYGAASYWVKTKILLAGVLMNWVVAILLLSIVSLVGMPKIVDGQFSVEGDTQTISQPLTVANVSSGSAAEKAGLKKGDKLLSIEGQKFETSKSLVDYTAENKGSLVEIVYSRAGSEHTAKAQLAKVNEAEKGILGVGTVERSEFRSTWSAPIVGVGTTLQFTWITLEGTGKLAWNALSGFVQSVSFDGATREKGNQELSSVSQNVAGPVGILGIIFPQASEAGIKQLLFLSAIISLSLAVINTLPIPALDGGRWFLMTIYKLRKKPLTKEREESIQTIGFMVLITLIILVTWADIGKFGKW